MSKLRVVCEHNFQSAKLQISSGKTVVLSTTLRGEQKISRMFQGRASLTKPIPAGEHTLVVKVRSPGENYEEEAEISGSFAESGWRTLHIEFGKGSGLGIVARKLTLSWQ
jgi:hypothetical protein